jgi:transketolase C-terminal domain/subunit
VSRKNFRYVGYLLQLTEKAKRNDSIFLIVGDLGFSVVEKFAGLFSDRFLNVGIAEQNMIGVAAGLAREGYNEGVQKAPLPRFFWEGGTFRIAHGR